MVRSEVLAQFYNLLHIAEKYQSLNLQTRMKTTMLFAAGLLFFGASAAFAQQDTTSQRRPAQSDNARQKEDANYTKDMVKIQPSELPENVRATLQAGQYKGWESGNVYKTKNDDGYLVEIKDGSRKTVHRFNADGRPEGQ